ncbi:MAG: M15 family metallopeptidase [Eubacteriales bacterium]|nr:M15 family metallopeptidase [Eubacteriales bacterium]
MTEWTKRKKSRVGMRGAAILALCIVGGACLLFLAVVLPLRALKNSPSPVSSPAPTVLLVTLPPSPSPTPMIPSVLTFDESSDDPMPTIQDRLPLGKGYRLRGTVQSNYPLLSVSAAINCAYSEDLFYPYTQTVTFDPAKQVYSYSLDDALTSDGVSLDSLVQFSALHTGIHTLTITATSLGQPTPEQVYQTQFYVLSDTWKKIQRSDFSNSSYETALRFFKDKDAFLYRYQWVDARYIVADPDWENEYIISYDCLPGREPWRIHKATLPYFEAVSYYLNSVHVRVSGTNGDSGILLLGDLIDTYNGSYCSRFTSSEKSISHHAFGTAIDLNGGMGANDNLKENKALIDDEVRNKLVYNGTKTENDVTYYDYTYSGDSLIWVFQSVPETVINYLLYELAFYRAGFQWGHYYISTSDGMHFTLTDNIRISHDGNEGLRKVFAYTEDYSAPTN